MDVRKVLRALRGSKGSTTTDQTAKAVEQERRLADLERRARDLGFAVKSIRK